MDANEIWEKLQAKQAKLASRSDEELLAPPMEISLPEVPDFSKVEADLLQRWEEVVLSELPAALEDGDELMFGGIGGYDSCRQIYFETVAHFFEDYEEWSPDITTTTDLYGDDWRFGDGAFGFDQWKRLQENWNPYWRRLGEIADSYEQQVGRHSEERDYLQHLISSRYSEGGKTRIAERVVRRIVSERPDLLDHLPWGQQGAIIAQEHDGAIAEVAWRKDGKWILPVLTLHERLGTKWWKGRGLVQKYLVAHKGCVAEGIDLRNPCEQILPELRNLAEAEQLPECDLEFELGGVVEGAKRATKSPRLRRGRKEELPGDLWEGSRPYWETLYLARRFGDRFPDHQLLFVLLEACWGIPMGWEGDYPEGRLHLVH